MLEALEAQQLSTPIEQNKSVGFVSWAAGGGYGFYVGSHGFGVDQILGAKFVLASGEIIHTDNDRELLWAIRGGALERAILGLWSSCGFKLYPVPKLYSGFFSFPLSEAASVFEKLHSLCCAEGNPDELGGDCMVTYSSLLPMSGPVPFFILFYCWTATNGDIEPRKVYL